MKGWKWERCGIGKEGGPIGCKIYYLFYQLYYK
nr:MAG TPA: hypothetical protein [Caudoviricetes sp.]